MMRRAALDVVGIKAAAQSNAANRTASLCFIVVVVVLFLRLPRGNIIREHSLGKDAKPSTSECYGPRLNQRRCSFRQLYPLSVFADEILQSLHGLRFGNIEFHRGLAD